MAATSSNCKNDAQLFSAEHINYLLEWLELTSQLAGRVSNPSNHVPASMGDLYRSSGLEYDVSRRDAARESQGGRQGCRVWRAEGAALGSYRPLDSRPREVHQRILQRHVVCANELREGCKLYCG